MSDQLNEWLRKHAGRKDQDRLIVCTTRNDHGCDVCGGVVARGMRTVKYEDRPFSGHWLSNVCLGEIMGSIGVASPEAAICKLNRGPTTEKSER